MWNRKKTQKKRCEILDWDNLEEDDSPLIDALQKEAEQVLQDSNCRVRCACDFMEFGVQGHNFHLNPLICVSTKKQVHFEQQQTYVSRVYNTFEQPFIQLDSKNKIKSTSNSKNS
ncbi:hypothetical protein RFI_04863 [Reticulomyxa filosa]|uniref:Uncharacterized protein n=1 Tax=Reticulomyxa filosa TaxID=46433 RepID=X6P2E7_RETFI|nr:hypothetical protein RFI_04863 [Reticulomyxa filosa]|eukprot:ETO32254.1 hypothetical protein RFI_04863 [Reticulomyxa filosa]